MTGFVIDAGALIALERGRRDIAWLVELGRRAGARLVVPSGVVAQVWRGGRGQARLGAFLSLPAVEVPGLDEHEARAVGVLLARACTSDVIDGWVALLALRDRQAILTSDPDDLRRIAPSATVIEV